MAACRRQTIDVDARKYFRLGGSGLFAMRARGFKSWGENPGFMYFGGNSEMRGYDYLSFVGQDAFYLNAELRFPLIEAMATPIGILGGIRGTLFANLGAAGFEGEPLKVYHDHDDRAPSRRTVPATNGPHPSCVWPAVLIERIPAGRLARVVRHQPADLRPRLPRALRLVVADALQQGLGRRGLRAEGIQDGMTGSSWLRKPKFTMWIGYDW